MKYPLTDKAKDYAKRLVDEWQDGRIRQTFSVIDVTSGSGVTVREMAWGLGVVDRETKLKPDWDAIQELGEYGLLRLKETKDGAEIILLQELRNAVESDFEVSEYFLTMNAVGMVVQGSVNLQPGAILQNAAVNRGNVQQTVEQTVHNVEQTLGEEFLDANAELRDALNALREATEADKQSKLGRVISELGRCLGHGANTATIISALRALIGA